MAPLTSAPLEPVFWALLVTFAVSWLALLVLAAVARRNQEKVTAHVDGRHVHCFPLDKSLPRECLICRARV